MKICNICLIEKNDNDFYKNYNFCKKCRYEKNKEYQKQYQKEYKKTDKYKEYDKKYQKRDSRKEYQTKYHKT